MNQITSNPRVSALHHLCIIVLFGALWGLVEASLGLVLHLLFPFANVAGYVLYPLGAYLMMQGFRRSGKVATVWAIAVVAAAVKAVDYLVPGASNVSTANVMRAIVLEGLLTGLTLPLLLRGKALARLLPAAIASFGWRLLFVGSAYLLPMLFTVPKAMQSSSGIIGMLFIYPAVNTLLVVALSYFPGWKLQKLETRCSYPWLVALLLASVVMVQIVVA